MKKIKITECHIPAVEYGSIEDCVYDNSAETKKYLRKFKLPKNKYDGEFAFIFKVKYMKKFFVVINCFSSGFLVEIINIFDNFDGENAVINKAISKSSYNLRKAISILKKYENNRLKLTERTFNYLIRLFKKAYKKLKQITEYDYVHITKHLKKLQADDSVQGYYYVKQIGDKQYGIQ